MGRPRVKGSRLPTLKQLLDTPTLTWTTQPVAWHDGTTRTMDLLSEAAVWYHCGKPPAPIRWVLIRDPKGELDTQALRCTDQTVAPAQIVEWFVLGWQLEVTYQEVRAHLGVETQRQWFDRAIARTTPVLMSLFSWVALTAYSFQECHPMTQRTAAWYDKPTPTFVDAIALVRRHLWIASHSFSASSPDPDDEKVADTLRGSAPWYKASICPLPSRAEETNWGRYAGRCKLTTKRVVRTKTD